MRAFLIIASALFAFGATMTFESTQAVAAVCADGVVRGRPRRVSQHGAREQRRQELIDRAD